VVKRLWAWQVEGYALCACRVSEIIVPTRDMSSSNKPQAKPTGFHQSGAINALCVAVLVLYFLHFAIPSLVGGFAEDEMTGMYVYWYPGTFKAFWANICFWKGVGRPAGALYYLPLYHFFALDPRPYRIIQISILASSIPIVYYLARLLSSSRSAAFLAVLIFCYQPQLAGLVFVGSFIYDALCGFFYFAALTYYIHIREKGRSLRPTQLVAFLALYICALNSKEMAVTLPVIVLIYEALRCPRLRDWNQFIRSNWRSAAPSLIAGLLTLPYIYGKTLGNNALAKVPGYIPDYSWHRVASSNAHFISELFYLSPNQVITRGMLLVLWVAIFAYAFWRRDRMLELMAFWVVITPLPLAFIASRGGACLYLLLFGWAMIFAKLASELIKLISGSSALPDEGVGAGATTGAIIADAATNRVRWEANRARGRAAGKASLPMFRVFATVLVAAGLALFTQWENQRFGRIGTWVNVGQKTLHVIQAFGSLNFRPAPGSTILLEARPFFQNVWYPLFVASLVWNDRSLRVYVAGQHQLTEQEIAKMDYIISLTEFQVKLVRAPKSDHP
jgi:hypothetical protein